MPSNITPLYFFSSSVIYSRQKEPIKVQIFEIWVLGSKFVKFSVSILKPLVNSSSNFASFFNVMTHSSSVNFKFIRFLHSIKWSHQSPNFETFECSGEYLPYSSCRSPNHKSIFLQIFYNSSVSWKVTSLYFFNSNIICFGLKKPVKVHIFENFECLRQNLSNSSCQFRND